MENKKIWTREDTSNNYIRLSFLPASAKINNLEHRETFFVYNSNWSLHWGIEQRVTNGLGYKKINAKKNKKITEQDLWFHLNEMEDIQKDRMYELQKNSKFVLIECLYNAEKEISRAICAAEKLKGFILEYKDDIEKHNEYMTKTYGKNKLVSSNSINQEQVKSSKKGFWERILS